MSKKYVNNKFKIFPKRYCESLYVKRLQSYQLSKLEVWQKVLPCGRSRTRRVWPGFESRPILIILNVWRTVTLQPFDLQRLTVPLWKDLDSVVNIFSAQETGSILKIGFDLSNWPHLHRAYVVTVCRVLSTVVYIWNLSIRNMMYSRAQNSTYGYYISPM